MFTTKVVLITGGSSGIGKEAALMFAAQGADIAIAYKGNADGADDVVREIEQLGRKAIAIQGDLAEESNAKRVIEEALASFGKIDVLVNNAGRYVEGDEWNGSSEVWLTSLQQNLISVMNMSKYAMPVFQAQRSGVIVNIASRHGVNGMADALSYSAAKAGVINLAQSYAKLLAPFGRANTVSPSATDAGYWHTAPKEELEEVLASRPSHKLVDPKTVAEKIVFLASDEAKDITGQNFQVTE